jgi:uncharacterized protein
MEMLGNMLMSAAKPVSYPGHHPHYETLRDEAYISLITFKRSGAEVPTPIWFAADKGVFYAYTNASAGKVKRIRNNAQVKVAPCNMKGKVTGPAVDAKASVLSETEADRVHGLLNRKYTWKKKVFELAEKLPVLLRVKQPQQSAYLAITFDV